MIWDGVVAQHGVRSGSWEDLRWSCDAARGGKEFLEGL